MADQVNKIKVMIVEDHEIVRQGMKLLFLNANDFAIVAEADNGKDAVEKAGLVKPNIILMDVSMPIMDGIEATGIIHERYKDIRVIMLTSNQEEKSVLASLASGANGYCLKDVSPDRLFAGMRLVNKGDLWLDSGVAKLILKGGKGVPGQIVANRDIKLSKLDGKSELSDREQDVLALIVEGCSNPEISEKLHISVDTVKTHIRKILEKLSVTDRTQAAVKAVRENIIE